MKGNMGRREYFDFTLRLIELDLATWMIIDPPKFPLLGSYYILDKM
jgi:hypothetical protein